MAEEAQTPPYGAYAAIAGTFLGGLAAAAALAKALDRDPQERSARPRHARARDLQGGANALARHGTWVAAALGATQIMAPRFGRLLTWTLGAGAVNDFLQAGFAALTSRASR